MGIGVVVHEIQVNQTEGDLMVFAFPFLEVNSPAPLVTSLPEFVGPPRSAVDSSWCWRWPFLYKFG